MDDHPPRYLDAGSAEPLHPAAREALLAALDVAYADPLRLHSTARNARIVLDNARAATAEALGVRPEEVTFTSSGTAAVHLGLLGLLAGARAGRSLAHSAVEHSAVFAAARWSEATYGGQTRTFPVDPTGRVDPAAIPRDASVVALQQANPEVGTVQPVDAVESGAALFVDACAPGGRLPLPERWDAAALSAHKWGGPPGVGVLLVRRGSRWRPPFPTDDRVDARVAGFENVPAALAAAAALQARVADRDRLARRDVELTQVLRGALAGVPDVEVHGDPLHRLPHLVSFSCLYLDGEALVTELDKRGFAVASGSACTASTLEPSHVLAAMGALTHGNVRVTLGPETKRADVEALAAVLPALVADLRARVAG